MTMPTRIYVKEYKGHKIRVISQGYAQIVQIDNDEPQHFTDTQTGAIYYCHQEIDKMVKQGLTSSTLSSIMNTDKRKGEKQK